MANGPGVPDCGNHASCGDRCSDWALVLDDEVCDSTVEEGMQPTGGSLEFPIEHVMSPEVGLLMKPLSGLVARTTRKGCGVV